MKKFLLLFLIMISFDSFAQTQITSIDSYETSDPIGKTTVMIMIFDCLEFDHAVYSVYSQNDTIVYNSNLFELDTNHQRYCHKIYFFLNNICVRYVCVYLNKIGNDMVIDKRIIRSFPDITLKKPIAQKFIR